MDFTPLTLFVRSWYKKKKSPNTHLSTFFLMRQLCTSIDLWARNGISQDIGGTNFKDCSKETWNCCKLSLKDYHEDCSVFTPNCHQSQNVIISEGMLISSESWNRFNLYSRLMQSFFGKIPSNRNSHGIGNWKKNSHKLSSSLIDFQLCRSRPISVWLGIT